MDVYRSLAGILTASTSASSSPISLVASQLSSASRDQKPELSRILAELLRAQPTPDIDAQKTLHDYIRSLVSTADLDDVSKDFRLAVDLADEELLLEILDETVVATDGLLDHAEQVHSGSDDAFAVDMGNCRREYANGSGEKVAEGHGATDPAVLRDAVIRRLRFWHFLFMVKGAASEPVRGELFQRIANVLPIRLLSAMALRNIGVAKPASNALCCFVTDFDGFFPAKASQMLWYGISTLVDAEVHVDLALALWLRWIAAASENVRPTQEIFSSDRYWALIQICLATGFSERRKYSLHLLSTSITLVQEPVKTRTFVFEPKQRKPITAAWTKYTTLIEITSLSTSPNQLRDATPDLKRLLDPASHVPASWLVVLVSLGFQSGSGGVARTFWEILLSLEKKRLSRLFEGQEGKKLLQDILLPYAATAALFVVRQSMPEKCEHGTQLEQWLGAVVSSCDKKLVARTVLQWIDGKEDTMFAPARAWILKGVLEGVKDEAVFDEPEDLKLLVKVAKMQRFTKLKTDVCIAIILRLLLSVNVEKLGFDTLWSALAEIIVKKEYILSEDYMQALSQRFGSSLKEQQIHRLVEEEKTDPSKHDLLKAALTMYMMSCQNASDSVEGVAVNLSAPGSVPLTRLDFWAVLLTNQKLFTCVDRLVDGSNLLAYILGSYSSPSDNLKDEADLAKVLELWQVAITEGKVSMSPGNRNIFRTILQSRWGRLQESQGQKFDQTVERKRSLWATICASAAKLMAALGESVEDISLTDIIAVIRDFDLPTLGRNKHDNIEMTTAAGVFIGSTLRLLDQCILASKEKIETFTVSEILHILPRLMRFLENESLLRALDVVRALATKAPKQLIECQSLEGKTVSLDALLAELWETVDAATLRSDFTKVYHGFIETVFHPEIISIAVEDEGLRDTISTAVPQVMKLGNGKRSIKPSMAKAIHKAFLHTPEHPTIIGRSQWLIDTVIELVNYSQDLKDKDFVVEHPLTLMFDKLAPGADHYRDYYGDREIFAQVYMFDMLSRMDEKNSDQAAFVKILREKLFAPWTDNYFGMSIWVPWKKHTHLQTLLLTDRFVEADEVVEFLDRVVNQVLCHEPHPRFRFLLEWIVTRCILRYPEHRNLVWPYLQFPERQNPKLQVSLLRVAHMVSRELPHSLQEAYFTELVYTAIPLTSNTKVVVRHQAIAMMLEFWTDAIKHSFTALTSNPIFARVHAGVLASDYYKKSANTHDFQTFDVAGNYTLAGIFSGPYLHGGDEIETIPIAAFTTLPASPSPRKTPLGTTPLVGKVEYKAFDTRHLSPSAVAAATAASSPSPATPPLEPTTPTSTSLSASTPLQTKGPSHTAPSSPTRNIILCASLVDNAINLGGLSRAAEILGVSTLTVSSAATTKTSEFTGVSVHSENWIDIQEVPIAALTEWLRSVRARGYTAVGVEQTDRSVVLGADECRFPEKMVLVLGTEKFGIPAELLGELDWCVEIPQVGRTRSMNVQTAAAVVLYEAGRQGRVVM